MAIPSELPQSHNFNGVEIWTQVWYNASCNDVPKLTVRVGDFFFNNTYLQSPENGVWFLGDALPAPESCNPESFAQMCSAMGIVKSFLSQTAIYAAHSSLMQ